MENNKIKIDFKEKKLISKEVITQEEINDDIEEVKIDLRSQLLEQKRQISKEEKTLKDLEQTYPVSFQDIVSETDKLEGAKRGMKILIDYAQKYELLTEAELSEYIKSVASDKN